MSEPQRSLAVLHARDRSRVVFGMDPPTYATECDRWVQLDRVTEVGSDVTCRPCLRIIDPEERL